MVIPTSETRSLNVHQTKVPHGQGFQCFFELNYRQQSLCFVTPLSLLSKQRSLCFSQTSAWPVSNSQTNRALVLMDCHSPKSSLRNAWTTWSSCMFFNIFLQGWLKTEFFLWTFANKIITRNSVYQIHFVYIGGSCSSYAKFIGKQKTKKTPQHTI